MLQLPNEILEEILCRLSVKCLLRFRCVSKSWFAVISSPNFVKLHLNRSVQTKRNLRLIRQNKFDLFREDLIPSLRCSSTGVFDSIPLTFRNYGLVPKCSCDGLICMAKRGRIQYISFWNPSTIRHYVPATLFW
ncbi:putative F-box protein At2g02030 [Impatiens glandulifera]|uniref:putative F-box protein At2g02030 n=1 Tax=Impatiens glandulifera TaxID=253017 RepID=UPI001FB0E902|nr:putative F-box protein At2g02030 [Impatiens glandulifera]